MPSAAKSLWCRCPRVHGQDLRPRLRQPHAQLLSLLQSPFRTRPRRPWPSPTSPVRPLLERGEQHGAAAPASPARSFRPAFPNRWFRPCVLSSGGFRRLPRHPRGHLRARGNCRDWLGERRGAAASTCAPTESRKRDGRDLAIASLRHPAERIGSVAGPARGGAIPRQRSATGTTSTGEVSGIAVPKITVVTLRDAHSVGHRRNSCRSQREPGPDQTRTIRGRAP